MTRRTAAEIRDEMDDLQSESTAEHIEANKHKMEQIAGYVREAEQLIKYAESVAKEYSLPFDHMVIGSTHPDENSDWVSSSSDC